MPNRSSKPKRPRDTNQLAKKIVDLSTGEAKEEIAALAPIEAPKKRGSYKKAQISN